MEKHVYFVRHGETDSNVDKIYRGREAALTETGRAQARLVAERVASLGVGALISSDFPRAHDTATIISERIGLPVESEPVFGEWREPSHMHGTHKEEPENKEFFANLYSALTKDDHRHADEETHAELVVRAQEALQLLIDHPAERICVVTHGGFLAALFGTIVFDADFSRRDSLRILRHVASHNTGVSEAVFSDEKPYWRIITWNDLRHFGEPEAGQ